MGITENGVTYYLCCGNPTFSTLVQTPPSVTNAWGGYATASISANWYFVGAGAGRLNGVWGRMDATTGYFNIVAVGVLGNKVLRSTSKGVWVTETVASAENMNAVWMAPTGEIFAVGANGTVNHYF